MPFLPSHPSTRVPPLASTVWALYSWPAVSWPANSRKNPRFMHLATCIAKVDGRRHLSCGQTVWGRLSEDGDAAMAWDWEEIAEDVIAMADPMRVISNIRLVDAEGDALTPTASALHFNNFIKGLPWQLEVVRHLNSHSTG